MMTILVRDRWFAFLMVVFCAGVSVCGSYFEKEGAVIIKVPVADCLGLPAQEIDHSIKGNAEAVEEFYADLPFCFHAGENSSPRIHQCLYNEAGILKKEQGDEWLIEFPHFYYLSQGSKKREFWMHKEVLKPASLLSSLQQYIPQPFGAQQIGFQDIIVLILPWQDQKTVHTYSAGTRFVHCSDADTEGAYGIFLCDYDSQELYRTSVDHSHACKEEKMTTKEAKKLFLSILRTWVSHAQGSIAYVFGGNSYTHRVVSNDFYLEKKLRSTQELSFWMRPSHNRVHAGFDCSGLVLRAAQIAGISYFCKNTSTIGQVLSDVTQDEFLEEGDLILIPGHVLVISDVQKNLCIESVGYALGLGCLREAPVQKIFSQVSSYEQVRATIHDAQNLIRIDAEGKPFGTPVNVRLVRLTSD